MKLKLTNFILFFFSISASLLSYDYNMSICALFQNEAPYLKEWIEFHRLVGVNHFWLYNNNSQDSYLQVLDPYIREGVVELIDWPSVQTDDRNIYQMEAFNDCIAKSRYRTKWLAIIGIDEFIVPVTEKSISALLTPFEQIPNVGGVKVFSQYFGTSNLWRIPAGQTLIESLILKAQWNHVMNLTTKTICRPERVQKYWANTGAFYPPFIAVTLNGKPGLDQPIQINKLRIHHYWTRHEEFFYSTKIPRREKLEQRDYSNEEIHQLIDDLDRVYDPTILRFVPQLRAKLGLNT